MFTSRLWIKCFEFTQLPIVESKARIDENNWLHAVTGNGSVFIASKTLFNSMLNTNLQRK